MKILIRATLCLALLPLAAQAQVALPAEADPSWTVVQGRSAVEMLPQLRVSPATGDTRRIGPQSIRRAAATEPSIGDGSQGVVFNHAMQSYGSLTGEISLRVAPGLDGAHVASQVGLQNVQRIGQSNYWVGRVASPQALRDTLLLLRAQTGVVEAKWVVNYNLPRRALDNARAAYR